MKRLALITSALMTLFLVVALMPVSSQTAKPQPLTLALQCAGGDCPLLKGAPQTAGMRSGFVRLKPGETVGWQCAGINRHAVEDARALQGRSSEPPGLESCGGSREAAVEA